MSLSIQFLTIIISYIIGCFYGFCFFLYIRKVRFRVNKYIFDLLFNIFFSIIFFIIFYFINDFSLNYYMFILFFLGIFTSYLTVNSF